MVETNHKTPFSSNSLSLVTKRVREEVSVSLDLSLGGRSGGCDQDGRIGDADRH